MKKYIEASEENGKNFYLFFRNKGTVKALNLLRFKKTADYTLFPDLKPSSAISGKEAYSLYMDLTMPFLEEVGGKVLFQGTSRDFLIGPTGEKWDYVLLVEHASVEVFIQFASNPGYQAIVGHRTAALEDSRLLPIE